MPISDIAQLQAATATPAAANPGAKLGQDAFLKLMTTQLKNQDPFEPMDNGEFLSQIAQFGTVTGIDDLKETFGDFANSMQSNQALQASNIIGRGVLAETNRGALTANGIMQGAVELDSYSPNVGVNVYDRTGQLVNRMELGEQLSGTVPFAWDGTTFSGNRAPAGEYTMEVEVVNGTQSYVYPTLMFGKVEGLDLGAVGQEMQVEVQGLGQIPFSQISKLL